MKKRKSKGFTMIELLMVILMISILSAVALPKFIDFRHEGKVSVATSYVNSLRAALKLSLAKARMSCDKDTYPSVNAILTNSILADSYCTEEQVPDPQQRMLLGNNTAVPANPSNNLTTVIEVNCPSICSCVAPDAGYYYNPTTGDLGHPEIGDCL